VARTGIELGKEYQDQATLFIGTATAILLPLHGTAKVKLEHWLMTTMHEYWFEESRLKLFERKALPREESE